MERNMFKKSLVVGIIFLFIGVGVQPVFAKNTIKTTISETLEDRGCQTVSNHNLDGLEKLSNRIEKLLNRVKIFTNIVAILSKNNPEISEKFKELSNRITTLKEINENQLWPGHPICTALLFISFSIYGISIAIWRTGDEFEDLGFDGIADMFHQMATRYVLLAENILVIWQQLGCDPDPT